ncbi:MAG: hypothetical protein ACO1OB_34860 [Archangium sp.]
MSERRWLEENAPEEVKALLESTVIDEPTPEQLASLRARVDGLMTTPSGSGGGGATGGGLAGKIIGGVTLLTLGLGGGVLLARREPAPVLQPPAPIVVVQEPVAVEPPPAPVVEVPPAPAPKVIKRVEVPPPATPSADEELELIQAAMAAPSAAQSLALVEQHVTKFPESTFAQEREVLAVKALMQAGRVDEAKARAEAFRVKWPTSPHLLRVESLISK